MGDQRIRDLAVGLSLGLLVLAGTVAVVVAPPSAAWAALPRFVGDGPGQITCSVTLDAALSPPLLTTGGGANASAIGAGSATSCGPTTASVSITSARFTGEFSASPITCQDTLTNATESLKVTWRGEVSGPVATYPDAIAYGGPARFSPSTIAGGTASGSFAGPATLQLDLPPAGTVSAGCAARTGLRRIALAGTLTLGTPTPPTVLPTSWWTPPVGTLPWQWELDHSLNLNNVTDMGTNDTLPNGRPAPDPVVYDIDAIDTPASTVAALHARGDHVICYTEVGSAGNYYSPSEEGLATTYFEQFKAAGVMGRRLSDYPEYFLNIDSPATLSIVEDMIAQQCYAKGFDAVETDLDETYNDNEGPTGFSITEADEQSFLTSLATFMHSQGLGWIAKNLDNTGDTFASLMEPIADGMITEQCNQYGTCGALSSYVGQKAVFNAEYPPETTAAFCAAAATLGFNGALFPTALNGPRHPCS